MPSAGFNVDDPQYRITPGQQMMSSCVGALFTSIFMTPLDVVKIRMQVQQNTLPSNHCFIYCNGLMDHLCPCTNGNGHGRTAGSKTKWYKRPPPGHFNGTLDAFVKIVKAEGFASLWSGLSPTLVLALPATVIYFTTYEELRRRLSGLCGYRGVNVSDALIAGGVARVWAVTLVSPLELIRTKMQSKRLSYREVGTTVRELVNNQGIKGLWRGLGPSLLRDVPFSALYWASYESYKKLLPDATEISLLQSFVGGAISGTIAAVVTLPFDVVKTLRQIELGERELCVERPGSRATSTGEFIRRIYNQRGLPGLFSGMTPRIIKVAPACAFMIASYEYGKLFFGRHNHSRLHSS